MDHNTKFGQMFSEKFATGLKNIKFFIDPNHKVSADEIREDLVAFQAAIDGGLLKEVEAVD
jgi:hypothetical protein